jgi:hypothetical protein
LVCKAWSTEDDDVAAMHEEKGAVPWQVSFAAGTASGVAAASSSLDKAAGSASEEAESGAAAASSVCTAAEAGAGALKEGVDFHIDDFTQKGPEKLLDDDITGFTEVTMELKMRKSPAKQQKLQPPPLQTKVPLELAKAIKEHPWHKQKQKLIITHNDESEDFDTATEPGSPRTVVDFLEEANSRFCEPTVPKRAVPQTIKVEASFASSWRDEVDNDPVQQPPPQPKRMPNKALTSPPRGPSRPAPSPPLEPPPPWWKIPESRSDDGAGDRTGCSTGSAQKRQADNDKNDDNGDRGRVTEQWRPRPFQERGRFGNRGGKLKEWWKAFHHAKTFGKESLDAFLVAHPKPIS